MGLPLLLRAMVVFMLGFTMLVSAFEILMSMVPYYTYSFLDKFVIDMI